MSRIRNVAGKSLLVSLSTLITLAVLEIGMRIFGFQPTPPEDTLRTYTEYDPMLGWKGRAASRGRYNTSEFSIGVALNSGGWRDDEPVEPRGAASGPGSQAGGGLPGGNASGAAPQVAVLGDSFAWGYGVERQERFSDRLEALLPGWNVQNYGVCGYGTDQELLVLRQSALKIAPRLVIVEFAIGNDLDNIMSAKAYKLPKPSFVLAGGALRLTGVPVPRIENWERAARTELRDFLTANLRIYAWVRPRWGNLQPRILSALGIAHDTAGDMMRMGPYERNAPKGLERAWELAEAILGAMRDDAARAGARLVVLVVPERLQVENSPWDEVVRGLGVDPARYDRDLPDRRLREIADRLGILLVDPLAQQRRLAAQGRALFLPEDPHWNAAGHAVAAEALREALAPVLDPLVRPSPAPPFGDRANTPLPPSSRGAAGQSTPVGLGRSGSLPA